MIVTLRNQNIKLTNPTSDCNLYDLVEEVKVIEDFNVKIN